MLIHFVYRGAGIVADFALDDRAIGVLSPAEAPRLLYNGYRVSFPRGRGVLLNTHPHQLPRPWMSRTYTSSSPKSLHGM